MVDRVLVVTFAMGVLHVVIPVGSPSPPPGATSQGKEGVVAEAAIKELCNVVAHLLLMQTLLLCVFSLVGDVLLATLKRNMTFKVRNFSAYHTSSCPSLQLFTPEAKSPPAQLWRIEQHISPRKCPQDNFLPRSQVLFASLLGTLLKQRNGPAVFALKKSTKLALGDSAENFQVASQNNQTPNTDQAKPGRACSYYGHSSPSCCHAGIPSGKQVLADSAMLTSWNSTTWAKGKANRILAIFSILPEL